MFSVFALIIIGAVFIAVLFILGSIKQYGYKQNNEPVDRFSTALDNQPSVKPPKDIKAQQSPTPRSTSPSRVPLVDYPSSSKHPQKPPPKLPSSDKTLFTKPATTTKPHYNSRPTTPVDNRPKTPIDRPTTPIDTKKSDDSDDKEKPVPKVTQRDVSEMNRRQFKTYPYLGAAEKSVIAHPKNLVIEVAKSDLQPLIDMMKKKDDDGSERYVVAYFNKANDKSLTTATDKFIRKSFKIALEGTDTFRFARFRINERDKDFFRLEVHDYTPYIEQQNPKYNPINHTISMERSFWLEVDAKLYHKSEEIKANKLSILVPGLSMGKQT